MFLGEEETANAHLRRLYFNIIGSHYNIYLFLAERVRVDGCAHPSQCEIWPEKQLQRWSRNILAFNDSVLNIFH